MLGQSIGRKGRLWGVKGRVVGSAIAALLVMLFAAMMSDVAAAQGRAAGVIVEPVTETEVVETAPIIGQFVASVEASIAARSGGIVDRVLVQPGDRISAGDTIAEIDAELSRIARLQAEAALKRAEAGVAQANARLSLAKQSLERAERLRGSTAFSRGSFEDQLLDVTVAESALASAQADLAGADANVRRADYDLRHAVILAPFDGVVLDRMAQPGAYIPVGAPVAVLLDIGALEIEVEAPAALVPGLTPGVETIAKVDVGGAAIEIAAIVRAVIPREAVSTRTRPVRFSVSAEDKARVDAAPGRSVTVQTPTAAPRVAVTAPKDSLVQARGGWIVYVVQAGEGDTHTAEPRPVTIGAAFGGLIEILSGVGPGDLVVVRGNERLRPGQAITPQRADGATDDSADPADRRG